MWEILEENSHPTWITEQRLFVLYRFPYFIVKVSIQCFLTLKVIKPTLRQRDQEDQPSKNTFVDCTTLNGIPKC